MILLLTIDMARRTSWPSRPSNYHRAARGKQEGAANESEKGQGCGGRPWAGAPPEKRPLLARASGSAIFSESAGEVGGRRWKALLPQALAPQSARALTHARSARASRSSGAAARGSDPEEARRIVLFHPSDSEHAPDPSRSPSSPPFRVGVGPPGPLRLPVAVGPVSAATHGRGECDTHTRGPSVR